MLSEARPPFAPSASAFYLYVANSDAAMAQAVAADAETIMDVADMPYGDRQSGVRDPNGHIWWISQRLTDKSYF
jgi:PhnB protein